MTVTETAEDADTQTEGDELTFSQLVFKLAEILDVPQQLKLNEIDHSKLQALMDRYKSKDSDWSRYALQEKSKGYTRNGVVNFGDNANLLVLVWNPGKGSAIHDHAGAHCVMKILQGELQEELFENPSEEGPMKCFDKHILPRDGTRYINDKIGVHRVTNQGTIPAVSLHLYTPPYAMKYGCNTFSENAGRKSHVDMSMLYSWQGTVVNRSMYSTC
ncbi:DEKNAAC100118 [Brettanomyces naardenensis]|uniref:Cysteine dioxygenase n=1 Tax=Brettanomyces naardenensis TaxID=13370 RepID=A0A448YF18_BRENA|nr:DEKNAAC100118 [Brettanomyces naardenensis]